MPSIETLIQDVENLFNGHTPDQEKLRRFGEAVANTVANRLRTSGDGRQTYLRLSNIGKPARQVYYDIQGYGPGAKYAPEKLAAADKLKFLYGDLIEELFLYLAEEAGHDVSDRQKRVEVDGVVGHLDAKIDGTVVDIKSASKFSFGKFADGSLLHGDDPFGYVAQVSGYATAEAAPAAIWAIEKERAKQTVLHIPVQDPLPKIKELRDALARDNPPARCYEPVAVGKSGNKGLPVGCSFCSHKRECWSDANRGRGLRVFQYSTGPSYLVEVFETPRVDEITEKVMKA
jgi:hypothetical protein